MEVIAPVAGTFFYLSYPWNGSTFIVAHNLALAIFSLWIFLSLSGILWNHGIQFENNYYFSIPEAKNYLWLFYLSKYYEYMDTFIIYSKGKQPSFLQKYHHVGAVICWHLTYVNSVDAVIIATLCNSFIHSIMYTFYLLSYLKFDLKFTKIYITSLQMLQFISGFTSLYLWYPMETPINKAVIIIFLTYNLGLVYLFWDFMNTTYFNPRKAKLL
jgi:hypothetical protein